MTQRGTKEKGRGRREEIERVMLEVERESTCDRLRHWLARTKSSLVGRFFFITKTKNLIVK